MIRLLNTNAMVRVRLTLAGEAIHARRLASVRKRVLEATSGAVHIRDFHEPDVDGWREYQLWELMHDFGADMFNGCDVPFVDNVIELAGGTQT